MSLHLVNTYPRCYFFTNGISILMWNVLNNAMAFWTSGDMTLKFFVQMPIMSTLVVLTFADLILSTLVFVGDFGIVLANGFTGPSWRVGEMLGILPMLVYLFSIFKELFVNA